MATVKKYLFDPNNGIYMGIGVSFPNPEQKGTYLINPKLNTLVAPPEFTSGQIPVFDLETKVWEVYTDYRKNTESLVKDAENKTLRNKTFAELIEDGSMTIDNYSEITSNDEGEEVITYKPFYMLLAEALITEEDFRNFVTERKRAIRNAELKTILDDIDKYENESKSVSYGLLDNTTIDEEAYKALLKKRVELCNFDEYIDFESEKSETITIEEVTRLTTM